MSEDKTTEELIKEIRLLQDDKTELLELIETLVYWNDEGSIDSSWWIKAKEILEREKDAEQEWIEIPKFLRRGDD